MSSRIMDEGPDASLQRYKKPAYASESEYKNEAEAVKAKVNATGVAGLTGNEVILLVHYVGIKATVDYYRAYKKTAPADILLELLYQDASDINREEAILLQKAYGRDLIDDIYADQGIDNPYKIGTWNRVKGWFGRAFNSYDKAAAKKKDKGSLRAKGIKADMDRVRMMGKAVASEGDAPAADVEYLNASTVSAKMDVSVMESELAVDVTQLPAAIAGALSEGVRALAEGDAEEAETAGEAEIVADDAEESAVKEEAVAEIVSTEKSAAPGRASGKDKLDDTFKPGVDMKYGQWIIMRKPEFVRYKTGITTLRSSDIGISIGSLGLYNLTGANFTVQYDENNDSTVANMRKVDFEFPFDILSFKLKDMRFSSLSDEFFAEYAEANLNLSQFFEFEAQATADKVRISAGNFDFDKLRIGVKDFSYFKDTFTISDAFFTAYGSEGNYKKVIGIGAINVLEGSDTFELKLNTDKSPDNSEEGWRLERDNDLSWKPYITDGTVSLKIGNIFDLSGKLNLDDIKLSVENIKSQLKIKDVLSVEPTVDIMEYIYGPGGGLTFKNMNADFAYKGLGMTLKNIGYENSVFTAENAGINLEITPPGGNKLEIKANMKNAKIDNSGVDWETFSLGVGSFSLFNNAVSVESPELSIAGRNENYRKNMHADAISLNVGDKFTASIGAESGAEGWNLGQLADNDKNVWKAWVKGGTMDFESTVVGIHSKGITSTEISESKAFEINEATADIYAFKDADLTVAAEGLKIDKSGIDFNTISGKLQKEIKLFDGFSFNNLGVSVTKEAENTEAEGPKDGGYYINIEAKFSADLGNSGTVKADDVKFSMKGTNFDSLTVMNADLNIKNNFINVKAEKIDLLNKSSQKGFTAKNLAVVINKSPDDAKGLESASNVLDYLSKDVGLKITEVSFIDNKLSFGELSFTKEKIEIGSKKLGLTVNFKDNSVEGHGYFAFPDGVEQIEGDGGVNASKAAHMPQENKDASSSAKPDNSITPADYGATNIEAPELFALKFYYPIVPGLNVYGGLGFGAGLAIYGAALAQTLEKEGERNDYKLSGNLGFSGNVWAEVDMGIAAGLPQIMTIDAEMAARLGLNVLSGAKMDMVLSRSGKENKLSVADGATATYGVSGDLTFNLEFAAKATFLVFKDKTLYKKNLGSWELGALEFAGTAARTGGKFTSGDAVKSLRVGGKPLNQLKGEKLGKLTSKDLETKVIQIKEKRESAENALLNLNENIFEGGEIRQEFAKDVDDIISSYSAALKMAETRAEQIEYGIRKTRDDIEKSGVDAHLYKRAVRIGYLREQYAKFGEGDSLLDRQGATRLRAETESRYKAGLTVYRNREQFYKLVDFSNQNEKKLGDAHTRLQATINTLHAVERDKGKFSDAANDFLVVSNSNIIKILQDKKLYKEFENYSKKFKMTEIDLKASAEGGARFFRSKRSITYGDKFLFDEMSFQNALNYEESKDREGKGAAFLRDQKAKAESKWQKSVNSRASLKYKSEAERVKKENEFREKLEKEKIDDYIKILKEYQKKFKDNYFISAEGQKENVGAMLRYEEARQVYYVLKRAEIADPLKRLEEHKVAINNEIKEINVVLIPIKEAAGESSVGKLEKGDERLLKAIRQGSEKIREKHVEEETAEIRNDQTDYLTKRMKKAV